MIPSGESSVVAGQCLMNGKQTPAMMPIITSNPYYEPLPTCNHHQVLYPLSNQYYHNDYGYTTITMALNFLRLHNYYYGYSKYSGIHIYIY